MQKAGFLTTRLICEFICFPFKYWGKDFGYDCTSALSLFFFYSLVILSKIISLTKMARRYFHLSQKFPDNIWYRLIYSFSVLNEPLHENPAFCICKNKSAAADRRLCFRYIDSTTPLISISEIPSLLPFSVVVQTEWWLTWSETMKDNFSRDEAHLISTDLVFQCIKFSNNVFMNRFLQGFCS